MPVSVLIADDEKDLVDSFSLLLRDLGYEVYGAMTGDETIRLLGVVKPEVLLLDVKMPKGSGQNVLAELSKVSPKTKVIISTGYTRADQNVEDRVLKGFKISGFLEKPSSIDQIHSVIQEVLKEA